MSHESIPIDEHVRLIQLQPEQADRLFELTDQNREYLGQFLPWPPYVKSVDDSKKHIEETIQKRIEDSSYTYGIEVDGVIAGDVSIRNLNEAEKTPEIGYWMAPDYAGKGLMTKAVQGLTAYGLDSLGLE
jgi:ribosomal-protein-serine acetyltransferase